MSLEEKVEEILNGRQEATVVFKTEWCVAKIFKIVKTDTGYDVYDLLQGRGRYPWPVDILEDYL